MKKNLLLLAAVALGMGAASANEANWVAANQGYENAQDLSTVVVNDDITLTMTAGTNGNNSPKYYNTGSAVRLYAGNDITITGAEGVEFSNVTFVTDATNPFNEESTVSVGALDITEGVTTWTGEANSFTIVQGGDKGHVRIQSIAFTYTGGTGQGTVEPEVPEIYNLTAILDMDNTQPFVMATDLTVIYANGQYNYVTDGQSNGLVYKKLGLEAGNVIAAGWEGQVSIYNELYEMVPSQELTVSEGGVVPTPMPVYAEDVNMMMAPYNVFAYLELKNVVFENEVPANGGFTGTMGGAEVAFYNSCKIAGVEAGTYDVVGFVSVYRTDVQFVPVEYKAAKIEQQSVYGVGSFQGWDPENAAEFAYNDATLCYTLVIDEAIDRMKISINKGDWDAFNAGAIYPTEQLENGQWTEFTIGEVDFDVDMPWTSRYEVTVNLENQMMRVKALDEAPERYELYLPGSMNGWSFVEDWKFETQNYVDYELKNVKIAAGEEFKISTDGWAINFGLGAGDYSPLNSQYDYRYLVNDGANLQLESDFEGSINFNIETRCVELKAKLNGEIYLRGSMNSWSASPEWAFVYEGEGLYALYNVKISANDEFKVADAEWAEVDYGTSYVPFNSWTLLDFGGPNCTIDEDFEGTVYFYIEVPQILLSATEGIQSVGASQGEAVYYNLQGIKVANPEPGKVYIRVQDGKASKVAQ